MGLYRKKPVVIEAVQYRAGCHDGRFADDVIAGRVTYPEDGSMVIRTLEGELKAWPGCWIIRGIKGELYPCDDEIFRATYEPVTELDHGDIHEACGGQRDGLSVGIDPLLTRE